MTMRRASIGLACAIGLLLIGGAWFLHKPEAVQPTIIVCADITQGCSSGPLQIRFDRTPQVMQPFALSANLPQAADVYASFAMQGMQMGLNRYRLLRQADGSWQARITLPVCIRGRSDWNMLLEVETTAGIEHYQLPFKAN